MLCKLIIFTPLCEQSSLPYQNYYRMRQSLKNKKMLKSTDTCILVRTCNEKSEHTVPLTVHPQFTNPQHPLPIHRGPNFLGAEVPHN